MTNKTNKTRFCIAAIVIFTLTLGASVAVLQDATPTTTGEEGIQDMQDQTTSPIMCESSLVLLVGLAQRDYGYQIPPHLTNFERGQYEGYYGADGQAGPGADTPAEAPAQPGPQGGMTTEGAADSGLAVIPDENQGQAGTVLLDPPLVLDEDVRCTELRASVEDFFMQQSRQFSGTTG